MDIESALLGVRQLRDSIRAKNPPPEEGAPSAEEPVIYFSLVRNTRACLASIDGWSPSFVRTCLPLTRD